MIEIILPISSLEDWKNVGNEKNLFFLYFLNILIMVFFVYVFSNDISIVKYIKKYGIIIVRVFLKMNEPTSLEYCF